MWLMGVWWLCARDLLEDAVQGSTVGGLVRPARGSWRACCRGGLRWSLAASPAGLAPRVVTTLCLAFARVGRLGGLRDFRRLAVAPSVRVMCSISLCRVVLCCVVLCLFVMG